MYQGRVVATETYRPIEILTSVAAIYFLIAFPVSMLTRRLELRLGRMYR
jgi:polar amino acid transport system permease protein